ncbi:hypothetical protein RF11_13085 [Thelohanellus kitauei]|uniref:Uncharacterized protein n=1 Tax=Thelohanellus kitauei TaxID=669202 RepID=A0A0C2JL57_THEKT|nr:hypothetical protein RF11_13085 [Thelohanellus kitauei]
MSGKPFIFHFSSSQNLFQRTRLFTDYQTKYLLIMVVISLNFDLPELSILWKVKHLNTFVRHRTTNYTNIDNKKSGFWEICIGLHAFFMLVFAYNILWFIRWVERKKFFKRSS